LDDAETIEELSLAYAKDGFVCLTWESDAILINFMQRDWRIIFSGGEKYFVPNSILDTIFLDSVLEKSESTNDLASIFFSLMNIKERKTVNWKLSEDYSKKWYEAALECKLWDKLNKSIIKFLKNKNSNDNKLDIEIAWDWENNVEQPNLLDAFKEANQEAGLNQRETIKVDEINTSNKDRREIDPKTWLRIGLDVSPSTPTSLEALSPEQVVQFSDKAAWTTGSLFEKWDWTLDSVPWREYAKLILRNNRSRVRGRKAEKNVA
jgi:hypothetical protein